MESPIRRKAWLALAIVAALTAVPAGATAAPPASDEYVLEIPGVRQAESGPVGGEAAPSPAGDGVQRGVVGEGNGTGSPLAALGDSLTAMPASIFAGIVALLAILLLGIARRHPDPNGSR